MNEMVFEGKMRYRVRIGYGDWFKFRTWAKAEKFIWTVLHSIEKEREVFVCLIEEEDEPVEVTEE